MSIPVSLPLQCATIMMISTVLLVSPLAARAAGATAELKVSGNIRPTACVPSLLGGGTVDYGSISTRGLKQHQVNVLDAIDVPFSINCDAPVRVALLVRDNKAAHAAHGMMRTLGATDRNAFGLGVVDGKQIGAYQVSLPAGSVSADGVVPDLLHGVANASSNWDKTAAGYAADGSVRVAFATPGDSVPAPYTALTGSIRIQPVLDKGANLPLESDIRLQGAATLEVVYL